MIVVDTNIIAYFVIPSDMSELAEKVRVSDPTWVAPILWRSEMRNVFAGYLRKGLMDLAEIQKEMINTEVLFAGREYEVDSNRVLELVSLSDCSSYDCEFVALSEQLQVPLVTSDKKILKAFPSSAVSLNDFASS